MLRNPQVVNQLGLVLGEELSIRRPENMYTMRYSLRFYKPPVSLSTSKMSKVITED